MGTLELISKLWPRILSMIIEIQDNVADFILINILQICNSNNWATELDITIWDQW